MTAFEKDKAFRKTLLKMKKNGTYYKYEFWNFLDKDFSKNEWQILKNM